MSQGRPQQPAGGRGRRSRTRRWPAPDHEGSECLTVCGQVDDKTGVRGVDRYRARAVSRVWTGPLEPARLHEPHQLEPLRSRRCITCSDPRAGGGFRATRMHVTLGRADSLDCETGLGDRGDRRSARPTAWQPARRLHRRVRDPGPLRPYRMQGAQDVVLVRVSVTPFDLADRNCQPGVGCYADQAASNDPGQRGSKGIEPDSDNAGRDRQRLAHSNITRAQRSSRYLAGRPSDHRTRPNSCPNSPRFMRLGVPTLL